MYVYSQLLYTAARGVVLPGGEAGPGALWGEDLPWGVFVMNALNARLTYRKDVDYILEVCWGGC